MRTPRHAVLAAVVTVAVLAVGVPVISGMGDDPVATREGTAGTATVAASSTPAGDQRVDRVTWDNALGVRLPVSAEDGPRHIEGGRAWGFTRTAAGTGYAAAHLVARTSPSVGPSVFAPTLAEQVLGPNRITMEQVVAQEYEQHRRRAGVRGGEPIPGADAELVGYRAEGFEAEAEQASVQLVLTSEDLRATGRLLVVLVTVQWADADWQLVAPPQGDWARVSRVLATPPTGMVAFGQGN